MRPVKQLNRHDPANGIYGDCHRAAIAAVLEMAPADVPHFMDGTPGKGDAPEAHELVRAWLLERGIYPINSSLEDVLNTLGVVNPHTYCLLGGQSRTGCNHTVVVKGDEIVCDPSQTDAGIIGPCDDGYYWVTFFGAAVATDRR